MLIRTKDKEDEEFYKLNKVKVSISRAHSFREWTKSGECKITHKNHSAYRQVPYTYLPTHT